MPATTLDPAAWRGRPVLVTGGSGLLGAWVVQALLGLAQPRTRTASKTNAGE